MRKIIKIIFWIIVILILFAIIPKGFFDKIKPYFDIEKFFRTLESGFANLVKFIEEVTGIDFSVLPDKIKDTLGIDLVRLWGAIKTFLVKIFEKLADILK